MPYDPNFPPTGAGLVSQDWRDQFNALKALFDALQAQVNGLLPVGFIGAWPKSRANLPALPGTWVECNGQTLDDPDSPFHGQTIDDLNGALGGPPRFLRGATVSGGTEDHVHAVDDNAALRVLQQGSDFGVNGSSSLPSYYHVVWVTRVK